jgi:hypothetical protein
LLHPHLWPLHRLLRHLLTLPLRLPLALLRLLQASNRLTPNF